MPFGLFALVACLAAGYMLSQRPDKPPKPVKATRTAVVRRGSLERTLRVSGSTASSQVANVLAPQLRGTRGRGGGELQLELEKLAAPGSLVRKGQPIAEFDRQHMLLRMDDYRASVAQQEQDLVRLRANLELRREQQQQRLRAVKGEMEKFALDLKTAPVRSEIQVQQFRMNYEEAKARYEQTLKELPLSDASETAVVRIYEIEVEQAKRELEKAARNLERMTVKAPMDGMLVISREFRGGEHREFEAGDSIGPGRSFAVVMAHGSMVVDAMMNQVDADEVRVGQKARLQFDGLPGVELAGHVVAVAGTPARGGQRAEYVRNVPVRLEIDGSDERVVPNLTASADIILDRVEDAVIVPRECVQEVDGKQVAYVQDGSGWARREVTVGMASNVDVVVEAGLQEGETVSAEVPY